LIIIEGLLIDTFSVVDLIMDAMELGKFDIGWSG